MSSAEPYYHDSGEYEDEVEEEMNEEGDEEMNEDEEEEEYMEEEQDTHQAAAGFVHSGPTRESDTAYRLLKKSLESKDQQLLRSQNRLATVQDALNKSNLDVVRYRLKALEAGWMYWRYKIDRLSQEPPLDHDSQTELYLSMRDVPIPHLDRLFVKSTENNKDGRAALRCITALLDNIGDYYYPDHLTESETYLTMLWNSTLNPYNCLFDAHERRALYVQSIYVDASNTGVGLVIGGPDDRSLAWAFSGHSSIPRDRLGDPITTWTELIAVEMGVLTFIHLSNPRRSTFITLYIWSDNMGVVDAFEKQGFKTLRWELTDVVTRILDLCFRNSITLKVGWINSDDNPADGPSRGINPSVDRRLSSGPGYGCALPFHLENLLSCYRFDDDFDSSDYGY